LVDGLATQQDTLVSATNIKNINGSSILGSGDLTVSATGAWLLASGGTLTAANTITANINGYLTFTGTWTATANDQKHISFVGTFTARNTASDQLNVYPSNVSVSVNAVPPPPVNVAGPTPVVG